MTLLGELWFVGDDETILSLCERYGLSKLGEFKDIKVDFMREFASLEAQKLKLVVLFTNMIKHTFYCYTDLKTLSDFFCSI